jgi:hypothetical protein
MKETVVVQAHKRVGSFTLDGKRFKLSPKVPTHQVERLMAGVHVGTSDADVKAMVAKRTKTWPKWAQVQVERFALKCHRDNQGLFRRVMGGSK